LRPNDSLEIAGCRSRDDIGRAHGGRSRRAAASTSLLSDRFDGIDACGADAAPGPAVPIERQPTVEEVIDELRAA
jgi:hypothetical protein